MLCWATKQKVSDSLFPIQSGAGAQPAGPALVMSRSDSQSWIMAALSLCVSSTCERGKRRAGARVLSWSRTFSSNSVQAVLQRHVHSKMVDGGDGRGALYSLCYIQFNQLVCVCGGENGVLNITGASIGRKLPIDAAGCCGNTKCTR